MKLIGLSPLKNNIHFKNGVMPLLNNISNDRAPNEAFITISLLIKVSIIVLMSHLLVAEEN